MLLTGEFTYTILTENVLDQTEQGKVFLISITSDMQQAFRNSSFKSFENEFPFEPIILNGWCNFFSSRVYFLYTMYILYHFLATTHNSVPIKLNRIYVFAISKI